MRNIRVSIFLVLALVLGACSKPGEFKVAEAWTRPANTSENGAVYFTISNPTNTADTLLSVSTDAASAAEVHMSMMDSKGVMSMKMQEAVTVPAGQNVEFKPGGLHVMLVGLTQDLKTGDTISLTLHFKNAGSITIQAPVKEY
jgi:copper(I)-binding protein